MNTITKIVQTEYSQDMNVLLAAVEVSMVPLNMLNKSAFNVRKQAPGNITELADNIAAVGLLQNLVVYPLKVKSKAKPPAYGVAAGQRRFLALCLLAQQGKIAEDYPVAVKIISEADALLLSLSENAHREAMHPADQIEAFGKLAESGRSPQYIASLFGITPLTVQRRLKLASLSPKLLGLLRTDDITLEQLYVLTLIDDHAAQETLWFGIQNEWEKSPQALRKLITANEIDIASHRLARFVGVEAYEAAGGMIRRDLFNDEEAGTMIDALLLQQLAQAKLAALADQIKAEGWQWVEVSTEAFSYTYQSRLTRTPPQPRELTDAETAQCQAWNAQREALSAQIGEAEETDEQDETVLDALYGQWNTLEEQIQTFQDSVLIWPDEIKTQAGVLICVKWDGEADIQRGFVRAEDRPHTLKTDTDNASVVAHESEINQPDKPAHSEKLTRQLTAHHSAAVQAEIAAQPAMALVLLTHTLACREFLGHSSIEALQVRHDSAQKNLHQHAPDLEGSLAWQQLTSIRQHWTDRLPETFDQRIDWLLAWPQEEVIALLAYCIAVSVDGVVSHDKDGKLALLADALQLDMHRYWQPTQQSYFKYVTKTQMVDVVSEAVSVHAATRLLSLKKEAASAAAERDLANSAWLPPVFRPSSEAHHSPAPSGAQSH